MTRSISNLDGTYGQRSDIWDDGTGVITVFLLANERENVEIYLDRRNGAKEITARVNWSACGSQHYDVARRYALLLAKAAEVASIAEATLNMAKEG